MGNISVDVSLYVFQVSFMENLLMHVERGLRFSCSLRALQKKGLVYQEITISHQWYLLTEENWVVMEVVSIILVD